jgi:subtilisin family serine protease
VVRFAPRPDHRYAVRLRQAPKELGKVARFHLTVLGGRLEYAAKHGSVPFPADGAGVIAVGAVDEGGTRHRYSSCGPCPGAPKPDLAAVVPFPSVWRPQQPFSGTSAAAPQAAALAALLWSRHRDWTADRVRAELRQAAGAGGHSVETGFGVVRLPPPR